MKKYLWSQKTLISNIYLKFLFADSIDSFVLFYPFARVHVIFGEFLHYVWTDVAIPFLKKKEKKVMQTSTKVVLDINMAIIWLFAIIKRIQDNQNLYTDCTLSQSTHNKH